MIIGRVNLDALRDGTFEGYLKILPSLTASYTFIFITYEPRLTYGGGRGPSPAGRFRRVRRSEASF